MKTTDTEVLGRQRAKPSKIKARYSQPTSKKCSYLCAWYGIVEFNVPLDTLYVISETIL